MQYFTDKVTRREQLLLWSPWDRETWFTAPFFIVVQCSHLLGQRDLRLWTFLWFSLKLCIFSFLLFTESHIWVMPVYDTCMTWKSPTLSRCLFSPLSCFRIIISNQRVCLSERPENNGGKSWLQPHVDLILFSFSISSVFFTVWFFDLFQREVESQLFLEGEIW